MVTLLVVRVGGSRIRIAHYKKIEKSLRNGRPMVQIQTNAEIITQ